MPRLAHSQGIDGFEQFVELDLGRTDGPGLVERGNAIEMLELDFDK